MGTAADHTAVAVYIEVARMVAVDRVFVHMAVVTDSSSGHRRVVVDIGADCTVAVVSSQAGYTVMDRSAVVDTAETTVQFEYSWLV